MQYRLLDDADATGDPITIRSGRHLFIVDGTFDGATVTLQYEGPAGSWISVDSADFTANDMVNVELPSGRVRALVAGGSPSGLYAQLRRYVIEK